MRSEFTFLTENPSSHDVASTAWLLTLLPNLLADSLDEVDAMLGARNSFVALKWRCRSDTEPKYVARAAFWAAQLKGALTEGKSSPLLPRSEWRLSSTSAEQSRDVATKLLSAANVAGEDRKLIEQGLILDVAFKDAPGEMRPSHVNAAGMFLQSSSAPPVGDTFRVRLKLGELAIETEVSVAHVRRPGMATPSKPAGFGLVFTQPTPALLEALACYGVTPQAGVTAIGREHPRFHTLARVKYSDEEMFSADYVSNLSFGGAFVKTSQPAAVDDQIPLQIELPSGNVIRTLAKVVFADAEGMGVQFQEDETSDRVLAAELARIACRPRRVLVVEDSPDWRKLLQKQCERVGLGVMMANDGAEALNLLTAHLLDVDMVIADMQMPVMDGLELVIRIRKAGGETELPLVIVTASDDTKMHKKLLDSGADGILMKTLSLDQIVTQAVDMAMRKRQRAVLGTEYLAKPAAW